MDKSSTGQHNSKRQGGFTIVEIVIVIVLIFCALVPMAFVITRALEASNEEEYLTHAAFLAQEKLEYVRAQSNCYTNDIAPGGTGCFGTGLAQGFSQDYSETAAACSFPAPFTKYECVVDDTMVAWSLNMLKVIQVRVWYDKDGDSVRDASEPQVYFETMMSIRSPNS